MDDEGVGDSGEESEDREHNSIERGGEVGGSKCLHRVHHPAGASGDTTELWKIYSLYKKYSSPFNIRIVDFHAEQIHLRSQSLLSCLQASISTQTVKVAINVSYCIYLQPGKISLPLFAPKHKVYK